MGHLINEEDFTANTGQGSGNNTRQQVCDECITCLYILLIVQSVEGKFKNSLGRLILRATKHKRKKEL